jgi:predicted RNA-binding protein with PIN domain
MPHTTLLLLDGYNVIHKIESLEKELRQGLQNARQKLAFFLLDWKKRKNFKGKLAVVFDGQSENFLDVNETIGDVKFYYSYKDSDADNHIIAILKKDKKPSRIIVITDDNYIRNHCKIYGAQVKPVSFLIQKERKKNQTPVTSGDDKHISIHDVHDINAYLKQKWGVD